MKGKKPKKREKYVICTESGEVVEVTRPVYLCWYASARQEKYQRERDAKHGTYSLDALEERYFMDGKGEYEMLSNDGVAEMAIKNLMIERLMLEVRQLKKENQELIQALYFDNVPLRTYADKLGINLNAVQKRRDSILKKLKKILTDE